MPTPRKHGGAALQYIPLTVPGFKGLNKESEKSILGPEWCTKLINCVIDETNRVASRKGYVNQTTTALPSSARFTQLFEYRHKDGTVALIGIADDNILYRSENDAQTWSDVTGTAVVIDDNVQFVNFNDNLIAFQEGGNPMLYSGTSFSDITDSGNQPTGKIGLAAFGRLWAVNSTGVEVQYSALLDETTWSGSDSGVFSMENVWPESDSITALAAFNGAVVVFGSNNIVVITDGAGSALGIDPTTAYVVDTISGIGCVARDSVVNVKGDLWFLSNDGLQSLGRLLQEKSNPLNNLSKPIQDFLIEATTDPDLNLDDVRAVYSPKDRFYLLSLPRTKTVSGSTTENGRCFVFDTRGKLEDGSARSLGYWDLVPRTMVRRRNNDLLITDYDVPGQVGLYDLHQDNGSSFTFEYESGWIDITGTQGYTILPKRIEGIFLLGIDTTLNIKWAFDFDSTFRSESVTFTGVSSFAEYGESEWGVAEWGGGSALREARIAGGGSGEYIKLGVSSTIDGGELAIQELDIFAKVGRLK